MGRANNKKIPLIISFFSLVFFNSARALCVPRNSSNHHASPPSHSPPKVDPPTSHISAPSPSVYPPSESVSPSHSPQGQPSTAPSGSPLVSPSLPTNPAIKKTCDATDYPALCLSTLAPFPIGKTDPLSVLELAVRASIQHTTKALAKATQLAAGADSSESILDCKDIYDDALDNFENAMDAIHPRDIGTVNTMLSAALTDFDTCEDGFDGESPFSSYDDKGTKLASICLAIASLVK
ncbi:pectinesterase inhibitor 10 [Corylus avellana]|uniref:pectinesterase inhibitor 10 n=1 Tax=Corylus avellana TaxID=13451 RepID=UPI001E23862A|nr:pectinesterase inhibitor 10 [Corylus avellana]